MAAVFGVHRRDARSSDCGKVMCDQRWPALCSLDCLGSRNGMFLNGIRVLDIGSYVAGPAAATVMSDFGADVVKVEPLAGDPYRTLLGGVLAEYPNFFWDQDSRNKRSLAIDFTTETGRDAIDRLIRRSDVVITNYRPELLAPPQANIRGRSCTERAGDIRAGQLLRTRWSGCEPHRLRRHRLVGSKRTHGRRPPPRLGTRRVDPGHGRPPDQHVALRGHHGRPLPPPAHGLRARTSTRR